MNRKKYFLALFLAIFSVLFIRNMQTGEPRRIDELIFKTRDLRSVAAAQNGEAIKIKRELLNPQREKFRMGSSRIFEPLRFAVPGPRPVEPTPAPPAQERPAVVETVMQKAVATFTFLGFIESERVKTIFLSRENEIFIVKKGDSILNEYMIKEITDAKIVIATADGSEVLEITLVENRPLKNQ